MIRIYSKKFNVSKSSLEYLVKGSSHLSLFLPVRLFVSVSVAHVPHQFARRREARLAKFAAVRLRSRVSVDVILEDYFSKFSKCKSFFTTCFPRVAKRRNFDLFFEVQ